MRRALRIALWSLGLLAGLTVVLAVAALLLIQTSWFRGKVHARIVAELEDATGGRVELKGFRFEWPAFRAGLDGLVIHGTEGPGETPLFQADSLTAGLKIVSLFRKRIDIQSLVVERPRVNVIVYADGRTNVPKPKAARRAKSAIDTVLDLAVKRFQLVNGTLRFATLRLPLEVRGEDLRALVLYERAPARYRGELAFRSLELRPGGMEPLQIGMEAKFTLGRERLEISRLHLALNASNVDASGAVESFASPRLSLDYAARLHLGEVARGLRLGPLAKRGTITSTGKFSLSGAAGYRLAGRLEASGLAVAERGVSIEDIRVESSLSATPGRIELGGLAVSALGGGFSGAAEILQARDFRVEGAARGFALDQMTRFDGMHRMEWNGEVSGPVRLAGTVLGGQLTALVVEVEASIAPLPGANPVSGAVELNYDHGRGAITFGPSHLSTRFSRVEFGGVLGQKLNVSLETTNLDDALPAIAMFSASPPPALPVTLDNGTARFTGAVTGPLGDPTIQGHARMTNFVAAGRRFDRAEADVVVSRSGAVAENATLARLGVSAAGTLRVGFRDWGPVDSGPVSGSFSLRAPSLAGVATAANAASPPEVTSGPLTASVTLGGTLGAVEASAHARASQVVFYGQPMDRVEGDARYRDGLLEISAAELQQGSSRLQISGRLEHPPGNWAQGRIAFQAASSGIRLAELKLVRDQVQGAEGQIEAQMAGEVTLAPGGFRPGPMHGFLSVRDLRVGGQPLGSLRLTAATGGAVIDCKLEGELAGAKVTGASQMTLGGAYPLSGRVEFTRLELSSVLARLQGNQPASPSPFSAIAAGALEFSGSALDWKSWKGTLQLPTLEVRPAGEYADLANNSGLVLRSAGAVVIDLDWQGARLRQAQFTGKRTDLRASGRVGFGARSQWDLRLQGGVNLALLREFDSRLYPSGSVALDVSVRGTLDRPDVFGRIDLHNASLNLVNFPNGLDNANGVIFLYRDRVIVDGITAESGGGKINIGGFLTIDGTPTFHLQAKAAGVRVRYPEGLSSTADAALTLTGTIDHSVLAGEVTATRVGLNLRSDLGSLLARSTQPVQAPAHGSRFEQGLRLDVHIATAPQVRLETKLAKDIQTDANLRLRGDYLRPVLLGRVTVNSGAVVFFGNPYTISSGQILFVNAAKIEPT
ncbi:MAG: translocation/assembly module TamB domain-containing protein, partial [Bryobacteraceae bacterium]